MTGVVYLIGTGPGDIGLLTTKAAELIRHADVVVYDRLINDEVLEMAREDAELIDVGKLPGNHKIPQEEINEIIAKRALHGKKVARIKGGDPFVFGRGGEEAEYLRARKISYEIVPGISSAVAALSYAGIPVTHRDLSSSFHVMTGHKRGNEEVDFDWEALAGLEGTLIFLMGTGNAHKIVQNLISHGKDPNTPAVAVMEGTTPRQKVAAGTLGDICERMQKEGIRNPAVIAIGSVVTLREKLRWFEDKILFGKKVLLTRSREQSHDMKKALSEHGADLIVCPTIKIVPLVENVEAFLGEMHFFDYLVFTSVNGVSAFRQALRRKRFDLRSFTAKVEAIGRKTAEALEDIFVYPDTVPKEYTSSSLRDILEGPVKGKNVALVTSQLGGETLLTGLRPSAATIRKVIAYRNEPNYSIKEKLMKEINDGIDIAVFTSPSTFNYMLQIVEDKKSLSKISKIASIGPVTKMAIEEKGFMVDIMPDEYTTESLIEEILKHGVDGMRPGVTS